MKNQFVNTEPQKDERPEQIMFIVWKWVDLEVINEKSLEKGKLSEYLGDIQNNKTSFYKEYKVEKGTLDLDAKVVSTFIYNTKETRVLLYALLEKYAVNDNEVMVFLHRGDFYKEQDVDDLLSHFRDRVYNCYLFADGRDYIYHKTQKSGFLDDAGGFRNGIDRETGEGIQTFDTETQKVKQPYFDRVWEYYKIEFEIKVFQLKEELFDCWFPFLLPNYPEKISLKKLIDTINTQNDRMLWLRLKSFANQFNQEINKLNEVLDAEKIDSLEEEKKALEKFEKKQKISYFFDDCINNLNHHRKEGHTFVADVYDEAKITLEKLLFEEETHDRVISKSEIRQLADQLNYLVKVIPGELD